MTTSKETGLKDALAALPVEEILSLCFSFANKKDRLKLYLDVLRQRGGVRAQFAATMICFDLARQGETRFQQEFVILAETVKAHAEDASLVSSLLREDPYLTKVWGELSEALDEIGNEVVELDPIGADLGGSDTAIDLQLFSDEDLVELEAASKQLEISKAELAEQINAAVTTYLGGFKDRPVYDPSKGFRLRNRRDEDRFEEFMQTLESAGDLVWLARGYRALALLFYGTSARGRGLFGGNKKKQIALEAGLEAFVHHGRDMATVVGVMSPLHADPVAWSAIADMLVEYVAWLAKSVEDPQAIFLRENAPLRESA